MKTCILALLCLFAASVAALAGASTRAEAVQLPGRDAPDLSRPLVSPHTSFIAYGDKTLAKVQGREGFSLWLLEGGVARRVLGAGDVAVEAAVIECVLPGEPAIFWLGVSRDKPGGFIRVDQSRARPLVAAQKPLARVNPGNWARSAAGEIVGLLASNDLKSEMAYLLKDAELLALAEEPLARVHLLRREPGGSLCLESPISSTRRLIRNGALVLPPLDAPEPGYKPGKVEFMEFRAGLVCSSAEPGGKWRSWIIKDGVSRWITDAAGGIFDGSWAFAMAVAIDGAEQIILPVFSYGEKGYGARYFRLDGLKAVEIQAPAIGPAPNIVTCDVHGFIASYMFKDASRHFMLRGGALVEVAFEKGFSPHEVKWCDGLKFGDAILVECFVGKRVALGALKDGILSRVLECDRNLDRECMAVVCDGKHAAATWTDATVHCVLVDDSLAITPLSAPGGQGGSTSPVSIHLCAGNLYAAWTIDKTAPLLRWRPGN